MQTQPDKMAEFQAQWTSVMEGWSDNAVETIVTKGVIPGTREVLDGLSKIVDKFLADETTETGLTTAKEVIKAFVPTMMGGIAVVLKTNYPELEQPFLREMQFHGIPGVDQIKQEILANYQEIAKQEGTNHA